MLPREGPAEGRDLEAGPEAQLAGLVVAVVASGEDLFERLFVLNTCLLVQGIGSVVRFVHIVLDKSWMYRATLSYSISLSFNVEKKPLLHTQFTL